MSNSDVAAAVDASTAVTPETQTGLRVVKGKVLRRRPVTQATVQVTLEKPNSVIELSTQGWAIERGDTVSFAGETDKKSGKFIAYAYRNDSKGVRGQTTSSVLLGVAFLIGAAFFCWAIFPLFTHLPVGLRQIAFANKVKRAATLLA